jgi:hypothetical protein
MALTTVTASGDEPVSGVAPGNRRRCSVRLTGDSSYPTNGSVVPASLFGLTKVDHASVGLSEDGTVIAVYDSVNNKLKCFSTAAAPVVEVANTTNLSTKVFPITVWGI